MQPGFTLKEVKSRAEFAKAFGPKVGVADLNNAIESLNKKLISSFDQLDFLYPTQSILDQAVPEEMLPSHNAPSSGEVPVPALAPI